MSQCSCLSLYLRPVVDVLRSMCCSLCLQAVGGQRAGAVATVMAAVDLARVRQPVQAEGGGAEEAELRQQVAADQQYGGGWTTREQMLTAQFTPEPALPLPQVR